MNRFRKLGFVDYNGDLKVHSSLLNVVISMTNRNSSVIKIEQRWDLLLSNIGIIGKRCPHTR